MRQVRQLAGKLANTPACQHIYVHMRLMGYRKSRFTWTQKPRRCWLPPSVSQSEVSRSRWVAELIRRHARDTGWAVC